jgi:biotin carboxyl carrier protein
MTIDDQTHEVEVKQQNSEVKTQTMTVNIGGKNFMATFVERDENTRGAKVKVNDKEFKVAFDDNEITNGRPIKLKLNEVPFEIKVDTLAGAMLSVAEEAPRGVATGVKGEGLKSKAISKTQSAGGKVIRPPMPGKIISVKVKEGDDVKVGDVVLILEAMKMANEISSPYNGRVKEVRVSAGQSVAPEDVAISIE